MKYFIIAGEPSGDLHGSNLIKELHLSDKKAEIFCWGGELMENAGATLLMHYRKLAFMGFLEVFLNLKVISQNLKLCRKQILENNPDVVILIDYPGFNLKIAGFARRAGFKVYYYISPKIWAWKESRIRIIRKYIDRMYIIFPFEIEFFKKHKYNVEYFGNPLVDEVEQKIHILDGRDSILKSNGLEDKPVIAILAGSRKMEIKYILPEMLKIIKYYPEYQFVLTCVKSIPLEYYNKYVQNTPVKLVVDKTYEILSVAEAALVTSGTATLETALVGTPQVVCYKGDFLSYIIAINLVKVKFISLVNLIMDTEIVKELLQYDLNEETILRELNLIVKGGANRETMINNYRNLRVKLGGPGASERVAEDIFKSLQNS
jgi:lipid-A-disaccharide synthase